MRSVNKLILALFVWAALLLLATQSHGQIISGNISLPTTITAPGVFGNAGANLNFDVEINGATPSNFPAYSSRTEAITGAIIAPSTTTAAKVEGIGGYVLNRSTTTFGPAIYGESDCGVSGCQIWGILTQVNDQTFNAKHMYGAEFDVQFNNSGSCTTVTFCFGVKVDGSFVVQPSIDTSYLTGGNFPAYTVGNDFGGGGKGFTSGYGCPQASLNNGAVPCLMLAPQEPGNSMRSQLISFASTTSSGTHPNSLMYENTSGQLEIDDSSIDMQGIQSIGAQSVSGCSLTSAIGGSWSGNFASGTTGTCTVTITPGFTASHGFFCVGMDLTTPADSPIKQSASSTTTCTLSSTTVSGDVITWTAIAF